MPSKAPPRVRLEQVFVRDHQRRLHLIMDLLEQECHQWHPLGNNHRQSQWSLPKSGGGMGNGRKKRAHQDLCTIVPAGKFEASSDRFRYSAAAGSTQARASSSSKVVTSAAVPT
jgi:hypothetical protein